MSKLKATLGLVFACIIMAGYAVPWCEAAGKGNSETKIKNLRFSVKGNRTCLIFDAEGGAPKQIGPESSDGISVFFTQMDAKLPDKDIKDGKIAAKAVKFRRESSFFEVMFREKNSTVSSSVQPGKNGKYTLILELTPSAKKSEPQAAPPAKPASDSTEKKAAEKAPQIEVKKVETSELFGSKVSPEMKNALPEMKNASQESKYVLANAGKAEVRGPARDAKQGGPPPEAPSKPSAFVEPDQKTLALYSSANEKFDDCVRNLVFCAPEIIEAYDQALKAGPQCPSAPLAVYRSALAHSIMGNYTRANKLFRQVVAEWPDHPVACLCWIGIGQISNRRQDHIEAMEAFRWAMRGAVEKADKAAAYYELGKEYLVLGANKEALEMLENCIGQDPDCHLKRPDVFRFIGEAHFALGNFEKAKEVLLRYVNFQQSSPDQDIILAKIAEIFLVQGEPNIAKKMYAFVGKYYTDSEGDLICRIRQGELLGKGGLEQAIKIYEDLRSKDLSPSLRRIVLMKLAALNLKKGDLARSLDQMDEAFPGKNDASSVEEASELRGRILCDLVRQCFSSRDFVKAVQLYEKYRGVFDSIQSQEILEQIAESYASLKFYSDALQIYDKLIAKGRKGDDLPLKCALYALRLNDGGGASQYCKLAQSEASDIKKSEIFGQIFYRDKKYADAVKSFGKVLQKGKEFEMDDPDSYVAYGDCLYEAKKFDDAVPILQKAIERAKADDAFARRSILVILSRCFAEQKQFQKAAEVMESAIQVSGPNEKNELMYEISKLYIAAGLTDKAVESLTRMKAADDHFWSVVAQQQLNTIDMAQKQ